MTMHVQFISSYCGEADYGVYVRRLGRDIRVRRDQTTDQLTVRCSELTADESAQCVAAVRAYLAAEHAAYLVWLEKTGLASLASVEG